MKKALRRMSVIILLMLVLPILLLGCALTQPVFSKNSRSDASVPPDRLKQHVVAFAEKFHPRTYTSRDNLDSCVEYISNEFKKAGGRVLIQEFKAEGMSYRNVRAFFGAEGGKRIIVGAHYDSAGVTPGADDNASGVAGLIELGALLGKADLDSEVELVAYCLEEPPFFQTPDMGSARHAKLMKEEKVDVRVMISLEMIGYFSDKKKSQKYPFSALHLFYPSRGNFIAIAGCMGQGKTVRLIKKRMKGSTDLKVCSINAPRSVPGIDFSDHLNYWNEGYQAVMITDTSFYRNANYHEVTDTPDTLDYNRMAEVVVAVYEAVVGL